MGDPQQPQAALGKLDDAKYIEALQQQMLRFAENQLSDRHLAEDAVQDALIGALKNADSFKGEAAFKTWVFAILKNKIADILRKRRRTVEISSLATGDEEDSDFSYLFDERGHWHGNENLHSWGNPEALYKQEKFWEVFENCLNHLPEKHAKIFMLREFIGLESEEICAQEALTTSHLHVILYRARLRLQLCLNQRWFGDKDNA